MLSNLFLRASKNRHGEKSEAVYVLNCMEPVRAKANAEIRKIQEEKLLRNMRTNCFLNPLKVTRIQRKGDTGFAAIAKASSCSTCPLVSGVPRLP